MLVLADDLTGALEAGAKCACEGIASIVTTELSLASRPLGDDVTVLAIDTDSRHLSPSDAGRRIRILASLARGLQVPLIYKKTDSTLRGNIGRELEALSAAFDGLPVIYVPAYPQMGRTVVSGRLLLDGRPVSETGFAADALNPIREDHIPTLVGSQSSLPVYSPPLLDAAGGIPTGIHVCDGTTDQDVLDCARVFLRTPGLRLAAGPAAFAHDIARLADWPRKQAAHLPSIKRCLIVSGSRSEVSVRQIECASARGFRSVVSSAISDDFRAAAWHILKPPAEAPASPKEMARRTGEVVRDVLRRSVPDALLVFGGDTARAVVQALGCPVLHPLGEVVAGVPIAGVGRPDAPDLYLIAKAGGFGPPDIIEELALRLQ